MITVMGATGHVGRQLTHRLLDAGEHVRALGRRPDALADLAAAGAETVAGDAGDTDFLTRAFTGADTVHAMLPYDPTSTDFRGEQARLSQAITTAIRASGVDTVVVQSSLGAELASGNGFIGASLHPLEESLRSLPGIDLLVLRCGLFFESIVEGGLAFVEAVGANADVVEPDVPIPMVATRDIAEASARALRGKDFSGTEVRELLGPEDLTYESATTILGRAIGRPDLSYVRLAEPDMVGALVDAGFSADVAGLHVEMGRAMSDGTVRSQQERPARIVTPTPFAEIVSDLLPAGYRDTA